MPDRPSRRALERPPLIHTRDPEMARLILGKVYGDLTVDIPRDSHRFEWRATSVDLGPVALFRGTVTSDVTLRGEVSDYIVSLTAGSSMRAAASREAAEISPGRSAAVFSPGPRAEWTTAAQSRTMTLRIDARYLKEQLEALTGMPIRQRLTFALSMPTADGAGSFLERLCHFLAAETERVGLAFDHPLMRASLGEALTRALLLGQPHDHAHLLARRAPASSQAVVRLVEEYVEAHAAEPIRSTDLVALVDAPMASIDAAFQAHRGTTPMAFLRKRRLALARERLLQPEPGGTVTDVAQAFGFPRRETFDAAYAAEFGETAVETRRRGLLAIEPPPSTRRATPSPSPSPSTVFVVNADPSRRETMTEVLREAGHTVQAFASPRAFLAAVLSAGAGCIVLDVQLPELSGLEVKAALRESGCALPVVFTSDDRDVTVVVTAMKTGAVDFLLSPVDAETLLAAVAHGLARDAEARAKRAGDEALTARIAVLSPREREVCERVARGVLNKQIAAELEISESSVRLHRAEGMRKLGVGSAAELGSLFARLGAVLVGAEIQ